MGKIIDGKKIASEIRNELKEEVKKFTEEGRPPGLSVVLVGDDPASRTYVRMKEKVAKEIGIYSKVDYLSRQTTQDELLDIVDKLNNDEKIDGILVQLPLPDHIDEKAVIEAISPFKDVDGFHPINTGKLFSGMTGQRFEACTPLGIIELLDREGIEIDGKKAVVVGRSNIVGKPVAHLLLERHATVTVCHSHTADLGIETRQADILVVAAGRPKLVKGEMVKEGAAVIDVGTNRVDGHLVGDVDFEAARQRAGYITPVPGGVGPMTIAMLMKNTVKARKYHGV
ncbi:bifunctional methylenetetrahydrofolate dehydrogenase/methenyltetrahydrofolate cyclohydrolase FolD [Halothermothrix orenii]|uniref:Bifunctional protein FolD n=1 Tax=Halothermothrix orenii (strain H 168 / OCM 544 / DSM 9562) TaxID=373903 RepID=FOLD_HALOH|nr:bifunctional methylenetetrahydrofolate dehydrogenase/methenyltetrahydrofolate cyclohydrolase FolD [Halothermothrix orenii]B8D2H8.1 RecName: Full=Bifunctional protein FolD; Includes: RecName: Full=Methylenetetrahydrofolate dehydrogenase; Includes: RecName: Full=Methenyltetrahydrofolate cyclohydrolase [Halothermothrix orenii H 168]ACL69405.1 tetrahydrofolate dehydrogenase/cyclohydrolase [Halothermothrix orenii H 168]